MKIGGHLTGKSLHAGLRRVPVQISNSDVKQRRCAACARSISDDRNSHTEATYCSKRCERHANKMRRAGRPIQWDGTKHATGNSRPRSSAEKSRQSVAMKEWHNRRRVVECVE